MTEKPRKEFSWIEGMAFMLAAIAIQLTSEATSQWGLYFYSPSDTGRRIIYISIGLVSIVFVTGRLFDAVTDPLIGAWSDKTNPTPGLLKFLRPKGRRRPFIFWGSILMTFTFIALWFPPVPGVSWANFFYALFIVSLHWVFWTICVIPLNSLIPEIARSESARIKLGIWYSVGMIAGLAVVMIVVPQMVVNLDPARTGAEDETFSPVGYQRMSLILAAVSLLLFQSVVWAVKERHKGQVEKQRVSVRREMGALLKNKPALFFLGAVFLHSIGLLAVQKALPYWAELGLQGDEETVSMCMIPYILLTLITYAFVPALSRRFRLKWLMFAGIGFYTVALPFMYVIAVLDVSPETKTILGAALFGWCGIGQGLVYVLLWPMLGEIIDYDERQTGCRREAVYGGLHGVAVKAGLALSILMATQLMNVFGNSSKEPLGAFLVGPAGGLLSLAGMAVLLFYPILNVTKDRAED